MKRKNLIHLFMLIGLTLLVSCGVSEEEKEERQANAFDISGGWVTSDSLGVSSNGYNQGATLFITNENSDRSNIKLEVIREEWSEAEEEFFDSLPLTSNDLALIENKFDGSFTFGAGENQVLLGGENISDDFGESTKVYLRTGSAEDLTTSNNITITYSLSGTVKRDDFIFRGRLTVSATERRETRDANGNELIEFDLLGQRVLEFNANNETAYFQQYFGRWNGDVELSNEVIPEFRNFHNVQIQQYDSERFLLRPTLDRFYFRGELFILGEKTYDLIELKIIKYPTLDFTYFGDNGSLIHFGGWIRSLGHFTGSVDYISNSEVETIGYFNFKRD